MLIIFDLDDTLIDTSHSITPFALKWALDAACVSVPVDAIIKANENAYSSHEVLKEFLDEHSSDEVMKLINRFPLNAIEVRCVPGAKEMIDELKGEHQLGIVSVGRYEQQIEKLTAAGIDPAIFDFIEITEKRDKAPVYQKIIENAADPKNILVVGDRIKTDLAPAKKLNMRTAHLRFGRGLNNTGLKCDVDVTIEALSEVKKVAYEYQYKNYKQPDSPRDDHLDQGQDLPR